MAAAAPDITGYEFLQPLGSGGFADVYEYEQELPRRPVAVKVLRAGEFAGPDEVRTFLDEANLMAQLSAHPAIVTVHTAGLLDDGRPYIVMEYCPRPNLGARFRVESFTVDDALAIGVQLAGAVETAHRAGVLHRDIKPANVLITGLGRPALADFGIASTLGAAAAGDASGMSLPWAAPETIDGTWSGPASDVYALGATVYSLLASRAPFEAGPGDPAEYASRIRRDAVPPTGRPDVPASLEKVLATSMAKSPQGRYTSALSFGRALQKVQRELGLSVTTLDVLDGSLGAGSPVPGDDTLTVRPVTTTGGRTTPPATAPLTARSRRRPLPMEPVYIAPAAVPGAARAHDAADRSAVPARRLRRPHRPTCTGCGRRAAVRARAREAPLESAGDRARRPPARRGRRCGRVLLPGRLTPAPVRGDREDQAHTQRRARAGRHRRHLRRGGHRRGRRARHPARRPATAPVSSTALPKLTLAVTAPSFGHETALPADKPLSEAAIGAGYQVRVVVPEPDRTDPRGTAAILRVLRGPDEGREFPLRYGDSTLGRDASCDVRLRDPLVSGRHARITIGNVVELVDLNSANGILVDGGVVPRLVLAAGRTAVVGDSEIAVVLTAPERGQATEIGGSRPFVRRPRVVARFPQTEEPPTGAADAEGSVEVPVAVDDGAGGDGRRDVRDHQERVLTALHRDGAADDGRRLHRQRAARASGRWPRSASDSSSSSASSARSSRPPGPDEIAVRQREAPSAADAMADAHRLGELLWSRRPEHWNFGVVRLGVGTAGSRIRIAEGGGDTSRALPEYVERLVALGEHYENVEGVPIAEHPAGRRRDRHRGRARQGGRPRASAARPALRSAFARGTGDHGGRRPAHERRVRLAHLAAAHLVVAEPVRRRTAPRRQRGDLRRAARVPRIARRREAWGEGAGARCAGREDDGRDARSGRGVGGGRVRRRAAARRGRAHRGRCPREPGAARATGGGCGGRRCVPDLARRRHRRPAGGLPRRSSTSATAVATARSATCDSASRSARTWSASPAPTPSRSPSDSHPWSMPGRSSSTPATCRSRSRCSPSSGRRSPSPRRPRSTAGSRTARSTTAAAPAHPGERGARRSARSSGSRRATPSGWTSARRVRTRWSAAPPAQGRANSCRRGSSAWPSSTARTA